MNTESLNPCAAGEQKRLVDPSPGSIFPGRFVHELHWDCDGIPDCNEILRIVCRGLWSDFGG